MIIVFTDNQIMDTFDSFCEYRVIFTDVFCIETGTYKE